MQLVALQSRTQPYGFMSDTISAELAERRVLARAIRAMRERRDMTQPDVAAGMMMSTQAYQKYEAGDRRLTADKIDLILRAVGGTREELEFERARVLGRPGGVAGPSPALAKRESRRLEVPIWGAGRMGDHGPEVFDTGEPVDTWDVGQLLGPETGALQGVGESMGEWLRPGEMVLFNRQVYPSPDDGCVIELKSGQMLIKLYVRTDGSSLFVRQLNPDQVIILPWSEVKGVYGVTLRGRRR